LVANNEQSSSLSNSSATLIAEQDRLRARLTRAEGIAASLENQLKTALPNTRVEYSISEDPSVMLMNFISSDLPSLTTNEKRYVTSSSAPKSLADPYSKNKRTTSKGKPMVKRKTSLQVE